MNSKTNAAEWFAKSPDEKMAAVRVVQPAGNILDCPNETGTWLAENMAEPIQTGAIEIIGDYLTSYRDRFAQAKALRELLALADRCEDAIRKTEAA